MQAENYFCSRGSFSIVSKQGTLQKFLVQRSSSLAYDAKVSEYEAFAYISLLLVARLSVGRNVSLEKAFDFLQEDVGWTSVSGYIRKVMRNPSIENVWIDLSMIELPNSLEELYDVYCYALDTVPEISRIGTFNMPRDLISAICSATIQDKDDNILDIACGDGAIVSNVVRVGYPDNKVYGVESCSIKAVIAKTRILLSGGDPSWINCCDVLAGANFYNGRLYDVIITNPPAGNRHKVSYAQDSNLFPKFEFQDIKYYETSYVIRSLELLKAGGRLAVFMPERVLCDKKLLGFRQKIIKCADVLAIITFSPGVPADNCGACRKCLLVLRRKGTNEAIGNTKTCFGIVACYGESNKQANFGLSDFIRFLKGDEKESRSAFRKDIRDNEIWLPRALVADEKFRLKWNSSSDNRISDYIWNANCVRTPEYDKSLYFLTHDVDGIRKSADNFKIKMGGRFVRQYTVAEANNLLVTFKAGRLLANVIPHDCEGLVIDRYSQMFSPLGYAAGRTPDWQVPLILELLFLSNRYRQYVKNRFVASMWKDDIVNFLLPPFLVAHKWEPLIKDFREFKERKSWLLREMSYCQAHVSEMYRREVILSDGAKRTNGIMGHWPLIKLGDVVHRSVGSVAKTEGILRSLNIDETVVDKLYLSAVLMANAKQYKIEDEIWQRTSRGYSQGLIDNVVLPLPEMQSQKEFAFRVEKSIARFEVLLKDLCGLREDKTVSRLVDQELGYAD